jgi:hypothetical protein
VSTEKKIIKKFLLILKFHSYEELAKLNPNWDFQHAEFTSYDQMSLTIE